MVNDNSAARGNMNTKNSPIVWATEVPLILLYHDNKKLIKIELKTHVQTTVCGDGRKQFFLSIFFCCCSLAHSETWLMDSHFFANFGFTHSLTRWTAIFPTATALFNVRFNKNKIPTIPSINSLTHTRHPVDLFMVFSTVY